MHILMQVIEKKRKNEPRLRHNRHGLYRAIRRGNGRTGSKHEGLVARRAVAGVTQPQLASWSSCKLPYLPTLGYPPTNPPDETWEGWEG